MNPTPAPAAPEPLPTLAEVERQHVERVLTACQGKVTPAARILGIGRATLYRRLAEYAKRPPK